MFENSTRRSLVRSSADFGKAEAKRNAVPVRKLKWVTISRKRNETNESLRTANNPRRASSFPPFTIKSRPLGLFFYCLYEYGREHLLGFKRISVRQRPDSEQILLTGTKCRKQNSVSVEEIQDSPPYDTIKEILTYVSISFIMKLGRAGITFWGSADFT